MKCAITRSNGQSSTTYKEKPEFFSRTLELYSSPLGGQSYDIVTAFQGVTDDNKVELPFEFVWPQCTDLNPGTKWLPNPDFEHQSGAPLPPTYYRASSNVQLVEYFLEARLYTSGRYQASQEVRCPLNYRPSPPMLNSIPALPAAATCYRRNGIVARTHRLHPDYDPNEGWRARIKHSWNKDKDTTPYANFKIEVSCPSIITAGQPIELTISLNHLERSKDIPDPPSVHLRRISVRMTSYLKIRIPSRSLFGSSDMNDDHKDKHVFLDRSFIAGEGLLMFDGMIANTTLVPLDMAPAFKTYGLELTHKLTVELWGECAREKFRFTPISGPVQIVACSAPSSEVPPPPFPAAPENAKGIEAASEVPHPPSLAAPENAKGAEAASEAPPSMEEDAAPPPYQVLDKD